MTTRSLLLSGSARHGAEWLTPALAGTIAMMPAASMTHESRFRMNPESLLYSTPSPVGDKILMRCCAWSVAKPSLLHPSHHLDEIHGGTAATRTEEDPFSPARCASSSTSDGRGSGRSGEEGTRRLLSRRSEPLTTAVADPGATARSGALSRRRGRGKVKGRGWGAVAVGETAEPGGEVGSGWEDGCGGWLGQGNRGRGRGRERESGGC